MWAGASFRCWAPCCLWGLCTGAILCCFAAVYIKTVIIPEAGAVDLSQFAVGENSVMYYMDQDTGNYRELVTLAAEENAEWVNYEDIPEDLINATVAIEDRRFWEHNGVDWKRTAAAILYMFTGQDIQGGSTITQQLIKNLTQYDDVTVKRKVIEIFRSPPVRQGLHQRDHSGVVPQLHLAGGPLSGCRGGGHELLWQARAGAHPGGVRQPDLHHQ